MDTTLYHNKDSEAAPAPAAPGGSAPGATLPVTDRTALKRLPDRGSHELALINEILDEGFVCHVGFTTDRGPVVIPTAYGRVGDTMYLHGSPASRMVRTLKGGLPVCVTVTLIDGLVLARSTFHHSLNYRSVVVFGTAIEVTDRDEKAAALSSFVEHIVAGRSADARAANEKELRGTTVLALPVTEASAKVRTGGPIDDAEDLELPVWAGVLPFAKGMGEPVPDPATPDHVPVPPYLVHYRR
jgi:nitroimidazol reductase NimA-like FMN-containing flavoprotein (pyridoxamine 5'-phosphate oxidase superfamily)